MCLFSFLCKMDVGIWWFHTDNRLLCVSALYLGIGILIFVNQTCDLLSVKEQKGSLSKISEED